MFSKSLTQIDDVECILTQLFLAQTIVKLPRGKILKVNIVLFALPSKKAKSSRDIYHSKSRYFLFITAIAFVLFSLDLRPAK